MIAFAAGEPEEPFLENHILFVPERHGEADALVTIRDSSQAVFVPAVGARPRVIGQVVPRRAVGAL